MKKLLLAVFFLAVAALPASANSITIDSTDCNNSGGDCYGLKWVLSVISLGGNLYQATLSVTDDPLVSGQADELISAVSFKASSSVTTASLTSAPTVLGDWTTAFNTNLSSSGCSGNGSGMVCSQTLSSPALYPTSGDPLVWVWQFTTTDTGVLSEGATFKIGAKLTTLDPYDPGKLLSVTSTVPEPSSLSLLGLGLLGLANRARQRWAQRK